MIFRRTYCPARRSPRQWWNSSVEVLAGATHLNAIGVNISSGGMCLFAVADLPVGAKVEIMFQLSGFDTLLKRRATVRHRALYLYGIEFASELGIEAEQVATFEQV